MTKSLKVAVTGAAGQIGYALVFRIASGQMFGMDVELELHLIELEHALPALSGIAMELEDSAFPLIKKVVCTSSLAEGMNGVNWALLVGSVPRKAGMERSDLLEVNGRIFIEQGKALNNYAADNVKVLVVGNPCNTNALITANHAHDISNDRFFAMTMLDELRAKAQLAKKLLCNVSEINNMCIWGNHSATQFPDFFHATVNNELIIEKISDYDWLQDDFIKIIQQRGAAVINARGSSSAASAANAVIASVSALLGNKQDAIYSVGRYSRGEYGVDEGLIFSYPSKTVDGKSIIINDIVHNEFANHKIHLTLEELRQERAIVDKLGLLKT